MHKADHHDSNDDGKTESLFIICTFTSFQLVYSTNLSPSIKISCPISVLVYQHLPFDEKRLAPGFGQKQAGSG
ncbi:hypothetical protein QNN00_11755 [Bacillus velezensis]|nr:hypothetical protein [Bacillus velezensis]MDJ1630822.1 hypothetical protein [Bacillus velezensis]